MPIATQHFDIRTAFLSDDDARRLYAHYPQVGASPDDYCPTCDKEERYFWRGEWHKCDCKLQLQLHKHYLMAGVGVTYQRLDWDDYAGDPRLKRVSEVYLESAGNYISRGVGIVAYGPFGSGKTLVLTLLLKELIRRGYRCYCTTFANMVQQFTAGWRSPEEQRYFERKVMHSDILLLDDLGREVKAKSNTLAESLFDNVLRSRVQGGRPTFLTTNLDLKQLSNGYGGQVLSLLSESGLSIAVNGKDFRPQSNERMIEEVKRGEFRPIV